MFYQTLAGDSALQSLDIPSRNAFVFFASKGLNRLIFREKQYAAFPIEITCIADGKSIVLKTYNNYADFEIQNNGELKIKINATSGFVGYKFGRVFFVYNNTLCTDPKAADVITEMHKLPWITLPAHIILNLKGDVVFRLLGEVDKDARTLIDGIDKVALN